MMQRI